jgi:hypothetical protein
LTAAYALALSLDEVFCALTEPFDTDFLSHCQESQLHRRRSAFLFGAG